MILNTDFSGNDFKNKMREALAFQIRSPSMEPERSNKKIYSPLYWSKLDLVDLGGKKVRLMHWLPIVQIGFSNYYCSKVNSRSFSGIFQSFKEQLRKQSLKIFQSSRWEEDFALTSFFVLKRLILKSHSVLVLTQAQESSGEVSSSFLKRVLILSSCVWYLGLMWEGILRVHLLQNSLFSLPIRSNSILTDSFGWRLPSLTFRTDFSDQEVAAIITVCPFSLASLYSAFIWGLLLTRPSTVTLLYTPTTLVRQKLGSVGIEQCIYSCFWKGFWQTCTDLIQAKLFLMLMKYLLLMMGTMNFSLFSRNEQQKKAVLLLPCEPSIDKNLIIIFFYQSTTTKMHKQGFRLQVRNIKKQIQYQSCSVQFQCSYITCASRTVKSFLMSLYSPQLKATAAAISQTVPMILARSESWMMIIMPTTWKPIQSSRQTAKKKISSIQMESLAYRQVEHLLPDLIDSPHILCLQISHYSLDFMRLRSARLAALNLCSKYSLRQAKCTNQMEPLHRQGLLKLYTRSFYRQIRHCLQSLLFIS